MTGSKGLLLLAIGLGFAGLAITLLMSDSGDSFSEDIRRIQEHHLAQLGYLI
jgi:hypothetical protein